MLTHIKGNDRMSSTTDVINKHLMPEDQDAIDLLKNIYPYRVTKHLDHLIRDTSNLGLRKQFVPDRKELVAYNNEFTDVCEEGRDDFYGIVSKYPNKVLLMLTYECFGNCRFCFRRGTHPFARISKDHFSRSLCHIEQNNISEVILSGGDPLVLGHDTLTRYITEISAIDSVKIIRIHTRAMTFDPSRITDNLLQFLSSLKQKIFFVFHVNQSDEITEEFRSRTQAISNNGILMFSQTALLKDVNDSLSELKSLFETLLLTNVKPYYLFHTDPVNGLGHFRVSLKKGIELYRGIYNSISGLAMPIYLMNVPPGHGHVIIDLNNIEQLTDAKYVITTWNGEKVVYHDIESQ